MNLRFILPVLLFHALSIGQIASERLGATQNESKTPENAHPAHLHKTEAALVKDTMFSQYHKLKKALLKYQAIKKDGGWETINFDNKTVLNYGSAYQTIRIIRKRLFTEGYLSVNSQSSEFDDELLQAIAQYQNNHNLLCDSTISDVLITSMNIPVTERMATIEVNLERSCLIRPDTSQNYVAVNIPAFKLYFYRNGKLFLESKVVVGKEATQTVIFNGVMEQIVFCPYWNIPGSIARKEILPAIKRNPKLFSQMRLEWHNGNLRQKPGASNALGLVKFIFPNSNNIYLHDTPLKAYFKESKRAFSHGCIRVEKACELATNLMKHDYGWSDEQTLAAMASGKEKAYRLKTKIPVYISYFTAWADDHGMVSFYADLYGHDARVDQGRSVQK